MPCGDRDVPSSATFVDSSCRLDSSNPKCFNLPAPKANHAESDSELAQSWEGSLSQLRYFAIGRWDSSKASVPCPGNESAPPAVAVNVMNVMPCFR